jgi:iron complex transport system substrate-binding protein
VAADLPRAERKRALYLAIYAGKLYGGTRGTSYHDVLTAAGLMDIAAERYSGWPQYDPEQLLQLDPPLIVTETGMGSQLCNDVWLRRLSVCTGSRSQLVEISNSLIGDPGLRMLDAAEALHDRVYAMRHP